MATAEWLKSACAAAGIPLELRAHDPRAPGELWGTASACRRCTSPGGLRTTRRPTTSSSTCSTAPCRPPARGTSYANPDVDRLLALARSTATCAARRPQPSRGGADHGRPAGRAPDRVRRLPADQRTCRRFQRRPMGFVDMCEALGTVSRWMYPRGGPRAEREAATCETTGAAKCTCTHGPREPERAVAGAVLLVARGASCGRRRRLRRRRGHDSGRGIAPGFLRAAPRRHVHLSRCRRTPTRWRRSRRRRPRGRATRSTRVWSAYETLPDGALRQRAVPGGELGGERGRHGVDLPPAPRRPLPGAGGPRGHGRRRGRGLPLLGARARTTPSAYMNAIISGTDDDGHVAPGRVDRLGVRRSTGTRCASPSSSRSPPSPTSWGASTAGSGRSITCGAWAAGLRGAARRHGPVRRLPAGAWQVHRPRAANPGWWNAASGQPYCEGVHFVVFKSVTAELRAFQQGPLDYTWVPQGQVAASRSLPQVQSGEWTAGSTAPR